MGVLLLGLTEQQVWHFIFQVGITAVISCSVLIPARWPRHPDDHHLITGPGHQPEELCAGEQQRDPHVLGTVPSTSRDQLERSRCSRPRCALFTHPAATEGAAESGRVIFLLGHQQAHPSACSKHSESHRCPLVGPPSRVRECC